MLTDTSGSFIWYVHRSANFTCEVNPDYSSRVMLSKEQISGILAALNFDQRLTDCSDNLLLCFSCHLLAATQKITYDFVRISPHRATIDPNSIDSHTPPPPPPFLGTEISKCEQKVAAATFHPKDPKPPGTIRLRDGSSVFSVALECRLLALNKFSTLTKTNKKFVIYTDRFSAVESLQGKTSQTKKTSSVSTIS